MTSSMDAEHLLNEVQMSTHPQGEVLIHVVDRDHEYWLDIASIERASLGGIPWIDGVTIEARPLSAPRAIRPLTTPRPYFQPIVIRDPEQATEEDSGQDPEPEEQHTEERRFPLFFDTDGDLGGHSYLGESQALLGSLESTPIAPPLHPIVGRTLYPAEQFTMGRPEHTQDLSEPHYEAARELNRQETLRALGLRPDMFVDAFPIDNARALADITPEEEEEQ